MLVYLSILLLFFVRILRFCMLVFWSMQKEEKFVFSDISEQPVPSLLRGYSAPIRLESDLTDSDLFFLLAHDSDEFNRFVFLNAEDFLNFVIELLMETH